MQQTKNAVKNSMERKKSVLVYPSYSRRSGGLSVGINLFPDKKFCSFDCPYCEVFPFKSDALFSQDQMEKELTSVINDAIEQNIEVKDICFSGSGEPTLSINFPEALERAARVRYSLVTKSNLVLITNGSGLLDEKIFSLLGKAVSSFNLDIWLKLDAGTDFWYKKISNSSIPFDSILNKIKEFSSLTTVTIQTMLCAVDGSAPPLKEAEAWEQIILEMAKGKAGIRKVQIYGKARPSPDDPKATVLPLEYLTERAKSLRCILDFDGAPPVEVYP